MTGAEDEGAAAAEPVPKANIIMTADSVIRRKNEERVIDIVGAGPSGLACAIALARAGYAVVVHERHSHVGGRFHGDFQGLENWSSEDDAIAELARDGIAPGFDCHAVYGGTAFDAWGERYTIESKTPLYYLVRRGRDPGSLDRGLLQLAQSLCVEVRLGHGMRQASGTTVLAGGPRVADAIAAGYVFETDMEDGNWVCFDNRLAPLGYSYLLVHGGRGTVAACLFTDFKHQADYVARTVATFRDRVGLTMRNERHLGGYANFRLPRTGVQGGHLVVGEQAGFQDALAGFGMRYALRSGVLAARSIIEDADYTTLWRRELLPYLRKGITNRFLFNSAGERGWRWVLRHRLQATDGRTALRRLYRESPWSRLLFPIAHWRYRAPLKDRSCDHRECSCVWCQCQAEEEALEARGRLSQSAGNEDR